jgi:hypothetical protein
MSDRVPAFPGGCALPGVESLRPERLALVLVLATATDLALVLLMSWDGDDVEGGAR